jgi:multicomponent Na+:H+ antiporter subunit G
MTTFIAIVLLWLSGIFTLTAAIGVLRYKDVFLRMHAAAKAGSVGAVLTLAAMAIHFESPQVRTQAVLIAAFLFITAPIASHLIARAILRQRPNLSPATICVELPEYQEDHDDDALGNP